MSIISPLKNLVSGLGKGFSTVFYKFFTWDFLFASGIPFITRMLRVYGIIAFLSTIISALMIALSTGTTPEQKIGIFFLELIKQIVTIDQNIYEISLKFNQMLNPTLWDAVMTFLSVTKHLYYYIWWHKAFKYMIRHFTWVFPFSLIIGIFVPKTEREQLDQSTTPTKINWWAFKMLYVFIIICNIGYITFISKTMTFNLNPVQGLVKMELLKTIGKNIFIILDTLRLNFWNFVIAFKGLIYYFLFGSFTKLILLLTSTKIASSIGFNISSNASTNLINST